MPETLFMIGREPELSVAELESAAPAWDAEVIDVSPDGVLLRHARQLPARSVDRLGGSIKQVEVLECFVLTKTVDEVLETYCTQSWLENFFSGRAEFGVSGYGLSIKERAIVKRHFLNLKKSIHATGRAVRLVISGEPQLSAVTVQRNGLVKNGKEFIFFRSNRFLIVGVTQSVQDYRTYAFRDFGRPAANAKSGMLPPKLAQIMLNLTQVTAKDILADPFCGSGTVLQEAALLGVQHIHGSDNNPQSVKDSQENIRWLLKEFPDIKTDIEILHNDARSIKVRPTVIVTEPYLGQPLRGHEPVTWLNKQKAELEKLYLQVFQHWKKQLSSGARVVMIWPEFVVPEHNISLNLDQVVAGLGFEPQILLSPKSTGTLNVGNPTVLSYGRDDARVRRQIRKWKFK